jgi:5-methyltetrahydropteroyltriglutamate--homocysteine methyltransferase
MGQDVVRVLREELLDLKAAGCEFVQFDEPVLTEVVMSEEHSRRTFM